MTTHVFLDTAPLLFAVGDPHPDRAGSRHLLAAAQRGELRLHVSAEAVQEFAHHRLRRTTRAEAVAQTRDVLALCDVHAMCTRWGARCSAGGSRESTPLRVRDAIHAATALSQGFDHITTAADVDAVPGLRRVAPLDAGSI